MLAKILIVSTPGCGKSSSLRYLNPKETLIIQGEDKLAIPFKWYDKEKGIKYTDVYKPVTMVDGKPQGNVIKINSPYKKNTNKTFFDGVVQFIKMLGIKYFVIDDMNRILQTAIDQFVKESGDDRQGYKKLIPFYLDMMAKVNILGAEGIITITTWQKKPTSEEVIVPGVYFTESLVPPSMYDVTLEAFIDMKDNYMLKTNGMGMARSPQGLFEDTEEHVDNTIPNDITLAIKAMKEY